MDKLMNWFFVRKEEEAVFKPLAQSTPDPISPRSVQFVGASTSVSSAPPTSPSPTQPPNSTTPASPSSSHSLASRSPRASPPNSTTPAPPSSPGPSNSSESSNSTVTPTKTAWTPTTRSEHASQQTEFNKVGLDDFELLNQIGEGSFGQVMRVRKKDSSEMFAMKILVKRLIAAMNEIEHTKSERNIMSKFSKLKHPFIVNIHFCFQTEERLYFILDYINGGHLYYHLQKYGPFDHQRAQLYAAEILLALQHLHQNHVVYRDLKAENVLLAIDGHIRLTDFGLSKELKRDNERATTFCGTSEYLAPEVLHGAAYGREVDWWAFGILIYEMFQAQTPFAGGEDISETYSLILNYEPDYPEHFPPTVIHLLEKLLQKDPKFRLADAEQIKKAEWFADLSFDQVLKKEVKPTYFPPVSSAEDDCLVDSSEFETEEEKVSIIDGFEVETEVHQRFRGFSYYPENK